MRADNPMRQAWLGKGETEGWFAYRLELLVSAAWQHRPRPLCRILERIEIEHLRHRGQENGGLVVSYDQFVAHGVSRRVIKPALDAGHGLGLLEIATAEPGLMKRPRRGKTADKMEMPNSYRLTYFPAKGKRAPTDEWTSVTETAAEAQVSAFLLATGKKQKDQFPFLQATSSLSDSKTASASSLSDNSPVPLREPPLTSAHTSRTSSERGGAARHQERRSKPPRARTGPSASSSYTSYKIGEPPPAGTEPLGPTIDRPANDAAPELTHVAVVTAALLADLEKKSAGPKKRGAA